jgi:DNA (cytosine-5)-methyltransferase 1
MSWLFSQALVVEYLGDISLDGEQSVQLSGNSTQQAYCAPDKMTKFSRLSRFGMMYKPLTENLGEELLKLYLGDFHAKTLAQQVRGGGITGSRSSMWKHMARIIGEVRPQYAFVENSPMLTNRGLGTVLGDLASLGFDAEWGVLSAADVGANHKRDRIWIIARNMGYSNNNGQIATKIRSGFVEGSNSSKAEQKQTSKSQGPGEQHEALAYPIKFGTQSKLNDKRKSSEWIDCNGVERGKEFSNSSSKGLQGSSKNWEKSFCIRENTKLWRATAEHCWWKSEPNMGRVADGVAARVDKLKAIGNGQVPLCAATAWRLLKERLDG